MLTTNVLYLDLINYMLILCSFIPFWVFGALAWQMLAYESISSHENESDVVEFFWTVFPSAAVVALCAFNLQCITYDFIDIPYKAIKVIGRQWYWSYDVEGEGEFDSVMSDFITGSEKPLRLIVYEFYRLFITSSDVIHSFSIPDFNIKVDAIPGRLNHVLFCPDRVGVFVGYCTELCGAGHAYMPIVIETIYEGSPVSKHF